MHDFCRSLSPLLANPDMIAGRGLAEIDPNSTLSLRSVRLKGFLASKETLELRMLDWISPERCSERTT